MITRTWSLEDACGNAAAPQVQTITVTDNTLPTFTAPPAVTINCEDNKDDLTLTGDVTDEADNCSTGIEASYTDNTAGLTGCNGTGTIVRTWTLSDNCNNAAASQTQTITVVDNEVPTFTRPADITIYTDATCSYDASVAITGDVTDEADNCSTGIEATFTDAVSTDDPCEGSVVITRTWSLEDACGNAAAPQVQTITVTDNTLPTFTAPGDVTINCEDNKDDLTLTGDVTDEADNCSTNIEASYTDNVNGLTGCNGTGTIVRTWTLSDNCNNAAASQTQTITVVDNEVPTFTRPADIEIFTDATCSYDASVAITGDVTDEADNCSTDIEATFTDAVSTDDPCEGSVVITRTWSLEDACGNAAAPQVQTITVTDNTLPTFTAPGDVTINCEDNKDDLTLTGDVTDEADNCSTGIEASYTDNTAGLTGCNGTGTIVRTWTLSDNCNNAAASQTQTITVVDNEVPTFTRPADITIYTDATCSYNASVAITGDVTDEADNCSTGIEATFTDAVSIDDPCEGSVVITRTWSLEDACGNAAAPQVQTITVTDNTVPTFTAPGDVTINCEDNKDDLTITGDVTDEADNCSTGIETTYSDNTTGLNGCNGTGSIIRTWSLVDKCNNAAATQTQTITVVDNEVPTFTRPADMEIFTDATCSYNASVAITGDVTDEADNCSTGIEATFTDAVSTDDPCEGSVVITRTWSLEDACGNAAAPQVQTITVTDNTLPTFTAPGDVTINCEDNKDDLTLTGDVTDEADNCSTNIEASYTDNTAGLTGCNGTGTIVRTWTLSDNCNNAAASQTQTITVVDNEVPTFTRPADIEIFTDATCSYDASVAITGDVTDEADNCSTDIEATFTDAVSTDDPCEGSVVITRTWSLEDACGNAAAPQVQTITVTDNTLPTFTAPADVTINCEDNKDDLTLTGDVTDEADNCSNQYRSELYR